MNLLLCNRSADPRRVICAAEKFCSRCSSGIWVSPASESAIAAHGDYQLVCVECGHDDMKKAERIEPPTLAQMDELRDSLGATAAEGFAKFVARFRQGGAA